jgi:hypothetical protein
VKARLTNSHSIDATLEAHTLNLLSISKSSQTPNVVMSLAAASEARKARLLALRKKRAGEDTEDIRYVTPGFKTKLVLMSCPKYYCRRTYLG